MTRQVLYLTLTCLMASTISACDPAPDPNSGPESADPEHGFATGRQDLHGPLPRRPPPPPGPQRLAESLRRWSVATLHQDVTRAAQEVVDQRLELDRDGRVLVQVALRPGSSPRALLTSSTLDPIGAALRTQGTTLVDLWVPPRGLAPLARRPEVAAIRPPLRPHASLGNAITQGVTLTLADRFHCTHYQGKGVHVAVVDLGFGGWSASSPELGSVDTPPPGGGTVHGTACAEILFDMAPKVVLHPIKIATAADLQAAVATLVTQKKVTVISDSLVWTGSSFADNTGVHCAMVDKAHQAGVVWVTSAGNHGAGAFYAGTFTDADKDGRHEFASGDELNELSLSANHSIYVELDWDDYPHGGEDYDLHLYQKQSSGQWALVKTSAKTQAGVAAPTESFTYKAPTSGTYALSVVRKQATRPDMPLRIFIFPAPGITLERRTSAGSLPDPAPCKGAIAVGAVHRTSYGGNQIWSPSSRGPTTDGRIKPDIAAPTGVKTSKYSAFFGTSASAPHVAGALALYIEATGKDALTASLQLLADAKKTGTPVPNNTFGHGQLLLAGSRCGWECAAGSKGVCPTTCGSSGAGICGAACTWTSCKPPKESCNGKDDDCDGAADNGFECALAAAGSCITSCGSTGDKTCAAGCTWSACAPPKEQCNGKDDDCDGAADNGFTCAVGVTDLCPTSCGSTGEKTCDSTCAWDRCVPPPETCDGLDEDCDGVPDNGFECILAVTGDCTTSCGSAGERTCDPGCTWGSCVPLAERCNAKDDDCDGVVDNGFECRQGAEEPCLTKCKTTGARACSATCAWGSCQPPKEQCNGEDDDCDGEIDEGEVCPPDDGGCACTLGSPRHDGADVGMLLVLALLLLALRTHRRHRA